MTKHFGLDIGSDNIRIVQLVKEKDGFRLVTAGMIKAPALGLASEAEKDLVEVAEAIKKLKSELKIVTHEVAVGIPERNVFSRIIEVPQMETDELTNAISWEAENLVPFPLAEVNLDWEVVEEADKNIVGKMKILLIACPTALVNKYLHLLKLADLEPVALETETLATMRCLRPVFDKASVLLVNIGVKSAEIAVISKGNLSITRSLPIAGGAITRSISSNLGLDLPVAEEYKKNYGLSPELEGKVAAAVETVLATVVDEIKKAIRFYTDTEHDSPKLMILAGGSALLPGISEYFTKALGLEVQIADPFSLVAFDQQKQGDLKKLSPLFAVALGLAMRE